jgi:hypothetical protein
MSTLPEGTLFLTPTPRKHAFLVQASASLGEARRTFCSITCRTTPRAIPVLGPPHQNRNASLLQHNNSINTALSLPLKQGRLLLASQSEHTAATQKSIYTP